MPKVPIAGLVLSIVSGVFILLNAVLLSLVHVIAFAYFAVRDPALTWARMLTPIGWLPLLLAVFGAVCGIVVLAGAYCLYKGRNVLGGVIIIVFSTLSFPIGGGFIVGLLLGVISGALAIAGV